MKKTQIKACNHLDIPLISRIALQSYQENYTYIWEDEGEKYMEQTYSERAIAFDFEQEGAFYFLIYLDHEPVGFLKLVTGLDWHQKRCSNCLELQRIYLLREAKGHGAGKNSIDFIIEFAQKQECKLIWLVVLDSSPAQPFYQKVGFKHYEHGRLEYPLVKDEFRGYHVMGFELK